MCGAFENNEKPLHFSSNKGQSKVLVIQFILGSNGACSYKLCFPVNVLRLPKQRNKQEDLFFQMRAFQWLKGKVKKKNLFQSLASYIDLPYVKSSKDLK